MRTLVLDASAVLALLLGEPGADRVKTALDDSVMTTVNLAEVVSHYARLGIERRDIEALLRPLPIRLAPIDTSLSYEAGMLRRVTLGRWPVVGRPLLLGAGPARGLAGAHCGATLAGYRHRGWCRGRTDQVSATRLSGHAP